MYIEDNKLKYSVILFYLAWLDLIIFAIDDVYHIFTMGMIILLLVGIILLFKSKISKTIIVYQVIYTSLILMLVLNVDPRVGIPGNIYYYEEYVNKLFWYPLIYFFMSAVFLISMKQNEK